MDPAVIPRFIPYTTSYAPPFPFNHKGEGCAPKPQTLNPKPLNPKPLNPKPLNPKPLNPKPQNPKPTGWRLPLRYRGLAPRELGAPRWAAGSGAWEDLGFRVWRPWEGLGFGGHGRVYGLGVMGGFRVYGVV